MPPFLRVFSRLFLAPLPGGTLFLPSNGLDKGWGARNLIILTTMLQPPWISRHWKGSHFRGRYRAMRPPPFFAILIFCSHRLTFLAGSAGQTHNSLGRSAMLGVSGFLASGSTTAPNHPQFNTLRHHSCALLEESRARPHSPG